MDGVYFHEKMCALLAQLGNDILTNLEKNMQIPLPASTAQVLDVLDALETGRPSADPLAISTHEIVQGFIGDMLSGLVVKCMKYPKTRRRREEPPLDHVNVQIRQGYPNDAFILCGGLE